MRVLPSANTVFVVLPCLLGMIESHRGTTAPAILPGGRRSVELHQGRRAPSSRATGVEPADPGLGGGDWSKPAATQLARRHADGGRKTFPGTSPRTFETRRCVSGKG